MREGVVVRLPIRDLEIAGRVGQRQPLANPDLAATFDQALAIDDFDVLEHVQQVGAQCRVEGGAVRHGVARLLESRRCGTRIKGGCRHDLHHMLCQQTLDHLQRHGLRGIVVQLDDRPCQIGPEQGLRSLLAESLRNDRRGPDRAFAHQINRRTLRQ